MKIDWFRAIVILAAGVLAVSLSVKCAAGNLPVTWQAPTKNCDGTPLTNLAGYRLRWGVGLVELPASALNHTVTDLPPGNWWVSIAAFTTTGQESQFVSAAKTIAPAGFTSVGGTVFTVVKRTDRFVLVAVGTVAPGVQCLADQQVNGHYAVPRSAVALTGTVRPDIVVTLCK